MYRDRLLNFGGFLVSFKGGLWLLGVLAWTVGLIDRTISAFSDGHLVTGEITQLIVVTAALVCWFYLKPASQFSDQFLRGEKVQE